MNYFLLLLLFKLNAVNLPKNVGWRDLKRRERASNDAKKCFLTRISTINRVIKKVYAIQLLVISIDFQFSPQAHSIIKWENGKNWKKLSVKCNLNKTEKDKTSLKIGFMRLVSISLRLTASIEWCLKSRNINPCWRNLLYRSFEMRKLKKEYFFNTYFQIFKYFCLKMSRKFAAIKNFRKICSN